MLFLLPLVRALLGASDPLPRKGEAISKAALPAGGKRLEFLRAFWDGRHIAPIGEQDSSALRALSAANALIERPIGSAPASVGDTVPFYLLENGG